ncbi:MAG: CheR family methyltransferase [Phycisphaeraceae bacterium]
MANHEPPLDVLSPAPAEDEPPTEGEILLRRVLEQVRRTTGCDFRPYKRSMVRRRIERRMALGQITDLARYAQFLDEHPDEAHRLLEDLLISVTAFFREPETFHLLAERVIPPLIERQQGGNLIRVWVPGCATGEDAYSLAMLFHEAFDDSAEAKLQIFATDIDPRALAFARTGRYPAEVAADFSADRRERFFRRHPDKSWQVCKSLRESIVFAPQNLLTDPPFLRLDLVCCRNLMIYLEPAIQQRVLALFHATLVPDGHLVLGQAESVGRQRDLFAPLVEDRRVYRRLNSARRPPHPFPVLPGGAHHKLPVAGAAEPATDDLADRVRRLVLQEYCPAAVVINQRCEVLHLTGPTRRYLQLPEGEPTLDILALVGEPGRHRLRAAVQETLQSRRACVVTVAAGPNPTGPAALRITVRPLSCNPKDDGLLLVLFHEAVPIPVPDATGDGETHGGGQHTIDQLQHELQIVREDLHATINQFEISNEQLRCSHEQVMSMNEELQSANEELETSQEELQSLNEELRSLNSQYQDKIEQLECAHDDINNFLGSTNIATVFLDADLCIKRFTASAARLLNLAEGDVGRPINRAIMQLSNESLLNEAAAVLDRLAPVEKEIRTRDGRWYTMRVLPYRTSENRIEGVVLTFSDVTRLHEVVEQSQRRAAQQAIVADLGQRALEGADLQTLMDEATRAVARTLAVEYTKVLELLPGRHELLLRAGVGWKADMIGHTRVPASLDSQAGYTLAVNSPVVVDDLATEQRFSGAALLHHANIVSGMSVVIQGDRRPFGVFGAHATQPRQFTQEDVNFLLSVANILSQAVARKSFESELKSLNRQLEKRVEQRTAWLRLMQSTTAAANEATGVVQAVQQILEQVCRHGAWAVGLAFVPAEDQPGTLRLLDCCSANRPEDRDRLSDAVRKQRVQRGTGLVGRAYQNGRPALSSESADEPLIACVQTDDATRLKTALALPVWAGDQIVAVLEFFSERHIQPDDRLLEVMTQIGTQLGRVIERERAARHLRESEYFINSVANTAPLLFAVVDLVDHRLVYANSQAQPMLGYDPAQLQAFGPELAEQLLHPDDREAFGTVLERLEASPPGTVLHGECRLRNADGNWRWFAVQTVGFTRASDGTLRQVLATLEDITERKRAEEALGESEQRFRAVFECAGLGIGLISPDGRLAATNPALEQMLDYTGAELHNRPIEELIHPDDRASDLNRCQQVLAGEEEQYDLQQRLLRRDQQPVWVHLHASLIRDRDGVPLYAIAIVQDVTERKNTDKALADLALREQQRIGQDLHDKLGQELTGLSYMAQSLHGQLKDSNRPEAEHLDTLAQGLRRALNHVRTVSRGLFPIELDARDLEEIMEELVSTTEAQYGVTCRLHVQARLPAIGHDTANHLFRIVQEAVRNAVKHANPEGIDVILRQDAQGRFEVCVEDDGSGISDHHGPAEGIGLRIMRHRASVIGADMLFESRSEGGTRIRCTFRKA